MAKIITDEREITEVRESRAAVGMMACRYFVKLKAAIDKHDATFRKGSSKSYLRRNPVRISRVWVFKLMVGRHSSRSSRWKMSLIISVSEVMAACGRG